MTEIDLEQVRAAMFAEPGVKAVDDLRLQRAVDGAFSLTATVTLVAPSVDLAVVRAVIANVLADQFAIYEIELTFNDPGPVPPPPTGAPLAKK